MKKSILILSLSILSATIFAQNTNIGFNPEPGKCYAKCLIPDTRESYEEVYPVYTGAENTAIDLKTILVETKPKSSRWVKKRADRPCLSKDPDDCLVWCLEDIPAETVELIVISDTTQTKDFKMETISIEVNKKAGGYTEFREVVCKNKLKKSLVMKIQQTLIDEGYELSKVNGKLNTKTKAALSAFQKDYALPIGQVDLETLKKLGIRYRG